MSGWTSAQEKSRQKIEHRFFSFFYIQAEQEMRTSADVAAVPLTNNEWWSKHVKYSKFRRQGIDIICASFVQPKKSKANVILLTGLMECFLKYSEIIEILYENGFNVFTYDHQSQGLSGRCKFLSLFFVFSLLSCCVFAFRYVSTGYRAYRIAIIMG
jgi:hypothetical protein